jgi:hypothetical protein
MLPGAVLICALLTWSADATHPANNRFIDVVLSGQNVPGGGDPDAVGTARLEEDHGTLAWEITYNNVGGETISGLHVHAPVSVGFDPFLNIPLPANRPLPGGTMSGVMTSADDPGLQTKMAFLFFGDDVNGFYLDLHTTGAGGFPNGAIRGQLPEPGMAGLVALGIGALLRRRR